MPTVPPKKDLIRWLRALQPHEPLAGLVLKQGTWFFGRANVTDYALAAAWRKQRPPRAGECFYNAQKFCLDQKAFEYWEGYLLIRAAPLHHAWVVMDDGRVVDFTLEAVLRKAKREGATCDDTPPLYCGLNIPRSFIRQRVLDTGHSEPVAEMYFSNGE